MNDWREAALQHAKKMRRGGLRLLVVVGRRSTGLARTSQRRTIFILDPLDYADAEDAGTISPSSIVTPKHLVPSEADKMACEQFGLPCILSAC